MKTIITTENHKYPITNFCLDKNFDFTATSSFKEQFDMLKEQRSYQKRQTVIKNTELFHRINSHPIPVPIGFGHGKKIVEYCLNDPEKAKELLYRWTRRRDSYGETLAFLVFNRLRIGSTLMFRPLEENLSLFNVLGDTVDRMSELIGHVSENLSEIFYATEWTAMKILPTLPISNRVFYISNAIKYGKATSWIFSIILHILYGHNETQTEPRKEDYWLTKEEIEIIRKITFERIQVEINSDPYNMRKPAFLFLFWYEAGTDTQRKELKEWIANHIRNDENFLKFVYSFTGSMTFPEGFYWRVYTRTLSKFLDTKKTYERLNNIMIRNGKLFEKAKQLAKGFDTMNKMISDGSYWDSISM